MKVLLSQGESLTVNLEGSDGEFVITWGDNDLTVTADLPDQQGREGVIYHETWHPSRMPEDTEVRFLNAEDTAKLYQLLTESAGKGWNQTTDVITRSTTSIDMGMDSLDLVEVIMRIEEEFGVAFPADYEEFANVGDLMDKLARLLQNATR